MDKIALEFLHVPSGLCMPNAVLLRFHMGMLFEKDHKLLRGKNLDVQGQNPHSAHHMVDSANSNRGLYSSCQVCWLPSLPRSASGVCPKPKCSLEELRDISSYTHPVSEPETHALLRIGFCGQNNSQRHQGKDPQTEDSQSISEL